MNDKNIIQNQSIQHVRQIDNNDDAFVTEEKIDVLNTQCASLSDIDEDSCCNISQFLDFEESCQLANTSKYFNNM